MQQLVFLYAFPLDRERRLLAESRGIPYPSTEEVHQVIEEWKEIWAEVNRDDRALNRFSELTGAILEYPTEVYVIGGMFSVMSRPFVMLTHDPQGKPVPRDAFVQMCLHEIAHHFISRRQEADPTTQKYWESRDEEYPDEEVVTRTHVLIYALLSKIIPEYGGAGAWESCKNISTEKPGYRRALDLMEAKGADACIDEFKNRTA